MKVAVQSVEARQGGTIAIAGVPVIADPSGALYWPEHGLLAVSDLHLEKGSSYAARGQLLPPYDTAATLARLIDTLWGPHTIARLPAANFRGFPWTKRSEKRMC